MLNRDNAGSVSNVIVAVLSRESAGVNLHQPNCKRLSCGARVRVHGIKVNVSKSGSVAKFDALSETVLRHVALILPRVRRNPRREVRRRGKVGRSNWRLEEVAAQNAARCRNVGGVVGVGVISHIAP